MAVKKMAFGGSWYPDNPDECKASIKEFLNEKDGPMPGKFIGGVVPHAGWFFSGSIACRVIASLGQTDTTDLIILFGGHMHPDSSACFLASGGVQTPFGTIDVDGDLSEKISQNLEIDSRTPSQFPDENTLELQYPFIKYFYPSARIIACCIPPSSMAQEIGKKIISLAQKLSRNFKVIGSTDMTHYGPNFGFTPAGTGEDAVDWVETENDRKGVQALMGMDANEIVFQGTTHHNMCCSGAAAATASACKSSGATRSVQLDYATSYEKSKGSSFVGYAGVLYALS